MMEIGLFLLAGTLWMMGRILGEIKKIERKIEGLKDKPKHQRFWGWGGKK